MAGNRFENGLEQTGAATEKGTIMNSNNHDELNQDDSQIVDADVQPDNVQSDEKNEADSIRSFPERPNVSRCGTDMI